MGILPPGGVGDSPILKSTPEVCFLNRINPGALLQLI
jgi:hypothetical protein